MEVVPRLYAQKKAAVQIITADCVSGRIGGRETNAGLSLHLHTPGIIDVPLPTQALSLFVRHTPHALCLSLCPPMPRLRLHNSPVA